MDVGEYTGTATHPQLANYDFWILDDTMGKSQFY